MKTILYACHSEEDTVGTDILSQKQLLELIDYLATGLPAIYELRSENGFVLSMGIGRPFGCAQYVHQNWNPPYLVATTAEARQRGGGEVDFIYWDELTPMPMRRCVPLELIKKVAVHFLNTGERSDTVEWESI